MEQTVHSYNEGEVVGIVRNIPPVAEHPTDSTIRELAGKKVVIHLATLTKLGKCPHPFVMVTAAENGTRQVRLGVPFIATDDARLKEAIIGLRT
jgi:hypothetical protein